MLANYKKIFSKVYKKTNFLIKMKINNYLIRLIIGEVKNEKNHAKIKHETRKKTNH